jgi:ankyrin repeat protein
MPIPFLSRRRLWLTASVIVLVTVVTGLVLFGPFLQARFGLALRGIASADYPRALHDACAHDDIQTLVLLRTARAGLDHRDSKGSTPLHTAVAAGAVRAVEILLEGGADQNLVDADGNPPLSLALLRDDASIARLLLKHGGSPLVPLGKDRQPAPFVAVNSGNLPLLRLLLACNLDANLADEHGVSLLAHAVRRQDHDMVEALLRHGADASAAISPGVSYLAHAVRTGDVKLAELLLDHGADVNAAGADGLSPLLLAVDESQPDVVRLLLERGAIVPAAHTGTPSPLQRAAEQDDIASVRLLLEHGADIQDPFPDGTRLIEYAVDTDKPELIRLLLRRGAQARDLAPRALRRNRADILSELLAGGASLDTRMDDQPLIEWAVRHASPELVGVLLQHGADPSLVGTDGQSLLALAVALDRPEVVAMLADHGADIDAKVASPASDAFADLFTTRYARFYLTKDRGLTPLMLAVLRGRQDTVRVLLERKARLDTPTGEYGTWPIGLAAYRKDVEMMQLLLGRDPDPAKQKRRILVSLADQTAALYEDGKLTLKTRVSTGRKGYETPPGKYVITNKHRRWKSSLYNDAPMPYFLRLNAGAIGLHEGVVPRHPASHGCIRVPRGTARRLFAATRVGDPVTIRKESLATAEAAYFGSDDGPASD